MSYNRWGFNIDVLKGINLTLNDGEWIILGGDNGSGKTTLLNLINSKLRPAAGEIYLDGVLLESLNSKQLSQKIFTIHQNPLLGTAPNLTVFENLLIADERNNKSSNKKSLLKEYVNLLEPVTLERHVNQLVKYLSGGERQLLAILIARLRGAKLILLDEPFSALDPKKVDLCLDEINKLHRLGKTILMVSHNSNHINELGTRTIFLKEGKIIYDNVK